jgi:hypothetical protein
LRRWEQLRGFYPPPLSTLAVIIPSTDPTTITTTKKESTVPLSNPYNQSLKIHFLFIEKILRPQHKDQPLNVV